jgi:magnesium chelatase family protein
MNPCPCGYLGHPSARCRCTPDQVARYRGRISGPLLDRIDLQFEVSSLSEDELTTRSAGERSDAIRARVTAARTRQIDRQGVPNARLGAQGVEDHCLPDERGEAMLRQAVARFGLSARAFHRLRKVARTIADLAGQESIAAAHMAEALRYRRAADA